MATNMDHGFFFLKKKNLGLRKFFKTILLN